MTPAMYLAHLEAEWALILATEPPDDEDDPRRLDEWIAFRDAHCEEYRAAEERGFTPPEVGR